MSRLCLQAILPVLLAASTAGAQQSEIITKVEFENDRILISRILIPPRHQSAMHAHDAASIEIFITEDYIRETFADGSVQDSRAKAGELACFNPVTHSVQNLRNAATEIIVVEFKGDAMKACPKPDPAAVAMGIEFENEVVRITRGKLGPGQTGQVHSHPEYVGIFLTDAKVRVYASDGTVREMEGERGSLRRAAAVTHRTENLADAPFEAITINLKLPPGRGNPR